MGQQVRVQLRPPDHGGPLPLPGTDRASLGRPVPRHAADQRATWSPYQPTTFPTPPFPEYSSGHSNFSAAGAEILKLFTGSDHFGDSVTLPAGSSKVEPGAVPPTDLQLSWKTFSDAADEAGISRRYGGIHFEQGDLDARSTGRMAARIAWKKAKESWQGY